jgi:PAS domain S-box-containing protein
MLEEFKIPVQFIEFDNYGAMLKAFEAQEIDAFSANNIHGFDIQQKLELHKTPIVFAPFDIYFAAPRNGRHTEKLAVLSGYVKNMKAGENSLLQAFEAKWFGVPAPYWTGKKIGIISSILLLFTILAMAFWRYRSLLKINQELTISITDREKAETALQKSEEKLRNILENLIDVYFETALDGTITYTNPSGAKLSGYTMAELIGSKVEMLYHNPQDRLGLLEELGRQGRVRDYEVVFRKKGGEPYDVSINADLFHDKNGQPAGLTGTIRDITQQKRLQEQLHRAKKMEALGLMASGIAHDLNNILSGIVSYPDLLLMQIPEESPLREPLKTIHDSGRRAAGVVADLLTIAKGTAVGKKVANLNTIITEHFTSGEHRKLMQDHPGIAVIQELDPGLLNISCSSLHLKKILMNLMANASDAIEHEGEITIRTTNAYLDRPLDGYDEIRTGEYVRLSVSDTGSGISKDDLPRIFEPFYTKKVLGRHGTGLGLAVVWNTVKDHDGYINVISGAKGTTFDLYFPVSRETRKAANESQPLAAYAGKGEKILVVDDEKNQRQIACALLTELGYSADSVASGEEALRYLERCPVDLLVLDMIMPGGMSGRETYSKVLEINPKQKAIIASGYAETDDVRATQEAGAGEFISKPYTLEKFGTAIRNELQKGSED